MLCRRGGGSIEEGLVEELRPSWLEVLVSCRSTRSCEVFFGLEFWGLTGNERTLLVIFVLFTLAEGERKQE